MTAAVEGEGELDRLAKEICEVCQWLHARNLLAAADGNVSARLGDGRVVITPSGASKVRLHPSEMAVLADDGAILQGRPSTERAMHLAIYRACPAARAVVHAHPPTAIAWTIARPASLELPADALPEVVLGTGAIPIVPYTRPGTEAVGTSLLPYLPTRRAFVLARHGAVCWGESLVEAYGGMERIEHVAQILKSAHELGGVTMMPEAEVEALVRVRATLGARIL